MGVAHHLMNHLLWFRLLEVRRGLKRGSSWTGGRRGARRTVHCREARWRETKFKTPARPMSKKNSGRLRALNLLTDSRYRLYMNKASTSMSFVYMQCKYFGISVTPSENHFCSCISRSRSVKIKVSQDQGQSNPPIHPVIHASIHQSIPPSICFIHSFVEPFFIQPLIHSSI